VFGLTASAGAAGLVESLLFGVRPTDPVTLGAALGVFGLVAVAACLVPAVRASRVDPAVAFRSE
jgi:putative ABC transport system permease protein